MKDNTYIVIQSWMRTELNLSGNELVVYATIYGFTQDAENKFVGSRQYLADWCGCSVRNVQTILNSLTERGLISKEEETFNGTKLCKYVANFTTSEKISLGGEKTSHNNIDNTIDNTKVLLHNTSDLSVNKKKNLFDKCSEAILEYTDDEELRQCLYDFLAMLLALSKESNKPLYYNVFKSKLNQLKTISERINVQIDVVRQSLDKGWVNFYAIKQSNYRDPMNESGVVNSIRAIAEEGELSF